MTLPTQARLAPTRRSIAEDVVEVRAVDPGLGLDLGDLRAFVASAAGLSDAAKVLVGDVVFADPYSTAGRLTARGQRTA